MKSYGVLLMQWSWSLTAVRLGLDITTTRGSELIDFGLAVTIRPCLILSAGTHTSLGGVQAFSNVRSY
jgi:hypothetical protein